MDNLDRQLRYFFEFHEVLQSFFCDKIISRHIPAVSLNATMEIEFSNELNRGKKTWNFFANSHNLFFSNGKIVFFCCQKYVFNRMSELFLVCFFFKQNANSNEVHTNWHNHAYTQNCILLHLPAAYVILFSFVVIFIMIFFSNSQICLNIFVPQYGSDDLNRFELNFVNAKPVCGTKIRYMKYFIYISNNVWSKAHMERFK